MEVNKHPFSIMETLKEFESLLFEQYDEKFRNRIFVPEIVLSAKTLKPMAEILLVLEFSEYLLELTNKVTSGRIGEEEYRQDVQNAFKKYKYTFN